MKWLVFIAGLITAISFILHLTVARKKFLATMLDASFDPVAKKIMQCQYHYVSTFSCLSAIMMILVGLRIWPGFTDVLYFLAANFLVCGLVQFFIALTSGLPKRIIKLNQWIGFVIVAVLLFIGA